MLRCAYFCASRLTACMEFPTDRDVIQIFPGWVLYPIPVPGCAMIKIIVCFVKHVVSNVLERWAVQPDLHRRGLGSVSSFKANFLPGFCLGACVQWFLQAVWSSIAYRLKQNRTPFLPCPPTQPQRLLKSMWVGADLSVWDPTRLRGAQPVKCRPVLMQKLVLTSRSIWYVEYLLLFPKTWRPADAVKAAGEISGFLLPSFLFLRNSLFDFV